MSKAKIKKALRFFQGIRFFFFSICIFLFPVQKSYPLTSTPGMVVLPFTVDSSLVEIRNSFTDKLIEKCKNAGYNAIGTRYLSSALKMGSCDSDECMRKIASLVGARYVIFGSIKGDTNSYKLTVNFKNLLEDKELLTVDRLFSGAQAPLFYVDELTLLIIRSLNGDSSLVLSDTDSSSLPPKAVQDSVSEIQPPSTAQSDTDTADVSADCDSTVNDTADSSLAEAVMAESIETETAVAEEKVPEPKPDTNRVPEENVPVTQTEQNQKSNLESSYSDNIAGSSIPDNIYIPPIKMRKTLFKPLPGRLDQQCFRGARLLVFGNTALAGLIGGLVMNDLVKKGLNKEAELYLRHENADREHLVATYESYKRQTEKTDRDARIRNAMYAVSGVCAVGFSISLFF